MLNCSFKFEYEMTVLTVKHVGAFKNVHEGKSKCKGERAVRFSWNKGSLINISAAAHERSAENFGGFSTRYS